MSSAQPDLQRKLAITPKTASLLIQAGYRDYRELQNATPNSLATQITQLGIPKTSISAYRRAFRRMVWLATRDSPEDDAKIYKDWTNKALMARGHWRDDFDDLTGVQIAELMKSSD